MNCYLTCPNYGTLVKVEFERADDDGRIVGVKHCKFPMGERPPACDEICVRLLNERVNDLMRDDVKT